MFRLIPAFVAHPWCSYLECTKKKGYYRDSCEKVQKIKKCQQHYNSVETRFIEFIEFSLLCGFSQIRSQNNREVHNNDLTSSIQD